MPVHFVDIQELCSPYLFIPSCLQPTIRCTATDPYGKSAFADVEKKQKLIIL